MRTLAPYGGGSGNLVSARLILTPLRAKAFGHCADINIMTKKHYVTMAKAIKTQIDRSKTSTEIPEGIPYREGLRAAATCIAQDFAIIAERDTPNFDTHQFYVACGLMS